MIPRARSLTDIFNLFHPKALTADQLDFYQRTGQVRSGLAYEYHESLFQKIKTSNDNLHLLVIGHSGCGKSTELHMLSDKLHDDTMHSIFIEALDDLSLNDFTYIDIFILMVKRLVEYAANQHLRVDKRILSSFKIALSTKTTQAYWNTDTLSSMEAGVSISLPLLLQVVAKITSALKLSSGIKEEIRQEMKPQISDLIDSINALIDNLNDLITEQHENGKIVIIIDGLEKCHQKCVHQLFIEDASSLRMIDTHLIITCPISLYRSPDASILLNNFLSMDVMPMIKTHYKNAPYAPYQEGISIVKELILKRIEGSFFEEDALEKIIIMAGGNLRDTCLLLVNCAHDAMMYHSAMICIESVDRVLNTYASDLFLRIDYKLYPSVKKIYDGDHRPKNNKDYNELMYANIIFEYNGERFIDLHPLIRAYIDKDQGVLLD